jgi:eukaryotic-like serine/threonine-protein kinase
VKETQWGSYVVGRKIGVGGMAEVYEAKKVGPHGFKKPVALKRILPTFHLRPEWRAMFTREAQIAAQLNHPNIIQVYDFGEIGEGFYIAMEYIDGVDLTKILNRQVQDRIRIPVNLAVFVIREVLDALNFAHNQKDSHGKKASIVHRDVSPSNVLISYDGKVKLTDFGIAKSIGRELKDTFPGVFKGKVHYSAPEQLRAEPADARTDLYAAGILLYILLTNRRPFEGNSLEEILEKQQKERYPRLGPEDGHIPESLIAVIQKALKPNRDERFQRASSFMEHLDRYLEEKTEPSKLETRLGTYLKHLFKRAESPTSDATVAAYVKTDPEEEELLYFEDVPTHVPSTSAPRPKKKGTSLKPLFTLLLYPLIGFVLYEAWNFWSYWKKTHPAKPGVKVAKREPTRIPVVSTKAPLPTAVPTKVPVVLPPVDPAPKISSELDFLLTPRPRKTAPSPAPVKKPPREKPPEPPAPKPAAVALEMGTLSVFPDGPFATVFLDGKKIGDTPILQRKVAAGKHNVRFENEKLGKKREISVVIEAKKDLLIRSIWGDEAPEEPSE